MEKILRRVYHSKKISLSLKIISHASVALFVVTYLSLLVWAYIKEPLLSVRLLVSSAVPYVLVSVVRRVIDAPRPYEIFDFYGEKPKDKSGQSFPSRHVFSAFTVAVLSYIASVWLCVALCVVGISIAVSRVLLGIHFVRDVVAGALVGIASGILGMFIII